jgi:hypothetical protein
VLQEDVSSFAVPQEAFSSLAVPQEDFSSFFVPQLSPIPFTSFRWFVERQLLDFMPNKDIL